ncbi:MFS transporter [Rothia dentocariosa]|uniref:MFS transporter n=1 Tax=Rothia dentocariosa TaxID=2047 RepID=UPI00244BBE77|nr:MFS transporter [Rothia dentocariosa]
MTSHVPDHSNSRRSVTSWVLWDVGSSSFGTIMMTFIFTVYLTSSYFGSTESASAALSLGLTVSGVCIAFFAPVSGQRADKSGTGIFWLGVNTLSMVLLSALCFFVEPNPRHLWLGVILISAANIFSEFAAVNYNAVLPRVSTPNNIGKISGIGWSAGYVGGLVALIIVLWGFIFEPNGLHLSTDIAFNIRAVTLFSALWCLVFCAPILIRMRRRKHVLPEVLPTRELRFLERGLSRLSPARQGGLFASYKELWRTIVRLRKTAPQTLYFLCASAIFRDGLAGIFTFGGVLAAGSFGFSTSDVIIFGVAANGVAAVGAVLGGYLDDYLGPKKIIIFSLVGILIAAVPLLLFPYPMTFWICALILALFVGPAQSSSRTFLARIADPGTEGELFGLYSTTGRATSFLSPLLFGLFVTIFNAQVWGILGIMVVVLAGLLLALPLESPQALHLRKARRAEKKVSKAAQR